MIRIETYKELSTFSVLLKENWFSCRLLVVRFNAIEWITVDRKNIKQCIFLFVCHFNTFNSSLLTMRVFSANFGNKSTKYSSSKNCYYFNLPYTSLLIPNNSFFFIIVWLDWYKETVKSRIALLYAAFEWFFKHKNMLSNVFVSVSILTNKY